MTHASEVVRYVRDLGVILWAVGGRLRYRSNGPLPSDLAELLKLWKEPILGSLTDLTLEALCIAADPEEARYLREERAAILEHLAGLPRVEAERRAGMVRPL